MLTVTAPVERKVYAATLGAGAGGIVAAFLLWLLGVTAWGASGDAAGAANAVAAVPSPVAALVSLIVTVGATFAAGWKAKHTPRPGVPSPETVQT